MIDRDQELLRWIKDFPIYRKEHLVYIPTLKCASTYYADQFLTNHWEEFTVDTIEWAHDHVFSFIMNPLIRRAKGLAEFITMYPETVSLLDQGERFWKNLLYLDIHSVPYHYTYHQYTRSIDWIPIDQNYPSEDLVIKLCQSHDIDINLLYNKLHESTVNKLEIYKKIINLTGNGSAELYLGIEPDMFLYNDVCARINPTGATWNEISWLKNQK